MENLTLYINDEFVFQFDKDHPIDDEQIKFLDRMDADMDRGIKVYGQLVKKPDIQQKATFVSLNLIKALQQDNQAIITASCAYLVNRMPRISEVHAKDSENKIIIEFIEENKHLN